MTGMRLLICFLIAAGAAGCNRSDEDKTGASSRVTATNEHVYEVTGVVVEVLPRENTVRIKHDEIPGYMQAMTMPFEVKDTNELSGLEAGDPVAFRLHVTETDGWIDQIRKTGPKTNDLPLSGPFRAIRDVEPLEIGQRLPEYQLTNQFGQPFSTVDFRGQALAINFLFTRCPFPTFCPLTARNFAETQQKLLSRPGAPTNWHLLTISFDPEFDTPSVLKGYAEHYGYNPKYWTFATGALIDITAIAEQLGLTFWRDAEAGGFSHNLRTVVIDAAGRIQTNIAGNKWTSDELVSEMLKAAHAKSTGSISTESVTSSGKESE